ncbi:DNA-directed RNA polymerase subunit beta [Novimethylophilus kurashikiensis]|uniref:DNA-directed RNA polymerase subunit beta n=1 Tax=Novimethylophilus kurashikiensis TaxID=1825523 RepID=A0A2R5F7W0_9PROT|nr:helix-turn-helix transcriptional regulator [Novimethylophilus kurashikiensis]GBG13638.1 DNA-directed RNA polymerase subunit beta [Novimethylophilus kurashikiensis]
MKDNVRVPPKHAALSPEILREVRIARRESQTKFWRRFGVTQSRGSRFELGTEIPPSVAILVKLYFEGIVSDGDLWRARRSHNGGRSRNGTGDVAAA